MNHFNQQNGPGGFSSGGGSAPPPQPPNLYPNNAGPSTGVGNSQVVSSFQPDWHDSYLTQEWTACEKAKVSLYHYILLRFH